VAIAGAARRGHFCWYIAGLLFLSTVVNYGVSSWLIRCGVSVGAARKWVIAVGVVGMSCLVATVYLQSLLWIIVGFHHPRNRTTAAIALAPVSRRLSVNSWRSIRARPAPKRRSHGDFPLPRFCAREEQIRDVGARDEEQESDGAEQQPDGAPHVADDFITQGEHDRVELHLDRIQSFGGHRSRDVVQLRCGTLNRGAVTEAAGGIQPVAAVVAARRVHLQRHPQFRRLGIPEVGREAEVRRHHPNDLERPAVDVNDAADDTRIGRVAPVPEPESEHDEARTVGYVLRLGEGASDERTDAQSPERVRGNLAGGDALRLCAATRSRYHFMLFGTITETLPVQTPPRPSSALKSISNQRSQQFPTQQYLAAQQYLPQQTA
jgi:hypothetical protein